MSAGDDFTGGLVYLCCGFAQQTRGKHGLEHGKAKGTAGLLGENLDNLHLFLFENIGGLQKQCLPFSRKRMRPRGKSRDGRVDGTLGVSPFPRWNPRKDLTCVRVEIVVDFAVKGANPLTINIHLIFPCHSRSSFSRKFVLSHFTRFKRFVIHNRGVEFPINCKVNH